jgi:hypothetical protein
VLGVLALWRSVVVSVLLALTLVLNRHWIHHHLSWRSNKHLRWLTIELDLLDLSLHVHWSWAQVLVWVKSTKSSHFSKACNLDQRWWSWLMVQWRELEWAHRRSILVVLITGPVVVLVA